MRPSVLKTNEFEFKLADTFMDIKYFSRSDILDYIVVSITKIITEIDNAGETCIDKKFSATQKIACLVARQAQERRILLKRWLLY